MKKQYFIFLFIFFLLNIFLFSVSGAVSVIRDIPNVNLSISSSTATYLTTYFAQFDTIYLQVGFNLTDFTSNYTITRSFGQLQYCRADLLDICLIPSSNEIVFKITTMGKTGCIWNQMTAWNSSNPGSMVVQGFELCAISENSNTNLTSSSSSFLSYWTGIFMSLFPESTTLNSSQKLGFVFISMALISALILFLFFYVTGSIKGVAGYVTFLIDIALFLFFIAIGYVPIIVLILIGLILIVIAFFRIKGGGGH